MQHLKVMSGLFPKGQIKSETFPMIPFGRNCTLCISLW